MQTPNTLYIDIDKIRKLLYDDSEFITEFSEAASESFREFSAKYEKHLLNRNETEFRKAGHKIKPVALMIGVEEVVDEYEHAKTLLHDNETDKKLQDSVDKIKDISAEVINELKSLRG